MAEEEVDLSLSHENDYQAAYIFEPVHEHHAPAKRKANSSKKTPAKKVGDSAGAGSQTHFVPLLNGAESVECVRLREKLFRESWAGIETRIQRVLREANQSTLDAVGAFVKNAPSETDKVPAAFIITGPNIASQDLLFEQLVETVREAGDSRCVGLRSSDVPNLKAALRKIISDATSRASEDDEDLDMAEGHDGRKYLAYDLEALYSSITSQPCCQVVVAFQDSEGFDGGLLSDLITLFSSWRDRIRFTLLFGVATSVDLFQARILKSAVQQLFGAQFDVMQASAVLESVFKAGVANQHAALRLGPSLLRALVDRQQYQVAGVQAFISSLKYAYMCHFYANSLSALLSNVGDLARELRKEHLAAVRTLDSFKSQVEAAVEARQLQHAQSLLDDDEYLMQQISEQPATCRAWVRQLLRSIHLMSATGLTSGSWMDVYIRAVAEGIDLGNRDRAIIGHVERMSADEITSLIERLLEAIRHGDADLGLEGWEADAADTVECLDSIQVDLDELQKKSKATGRCLKSKYSTQSKVLRTTVVAQKVQLSQDSATLTAEDKAFANIVDKLSELLTSTMFSDPIGGVFLRETFVYDAKTPYRDVFVPSPGMVLERALSSPHDYLGCSCCQLEDGSETASTSPTTAILYRLYREAGSLINVADMWSAYHVLVGDDTEAGLDERTALVHFYRGLAELRAMGFVKPSRKKTDHVAKVKWL